MLSDEEFGFLWLFPSHGRMTGFASLDEKRNIFIKAADDFAKEDETIGMYGIGYS